MLQHNRLARQAHLAHAAVLGLHTLCCGLPVLALLAAILAGATSGLALFADYLGVFHEFMHAYEAQILVVSAVLVGVGGVLELRRRHEHGSLWLFGVSVLCFLANAAIVVLHRA
jgi:hypothetical protein